MNSTIARLARQGAGMLLALTVAGSVAAESPAVTDGKIATMTPATTSAAVPRAGTSGERSVAMSTWHLAAAPPQGSLHRYYREQSRAQAARTAEKRSSRRSAGMAMDSDRSDSVTNPFSGETQAPAVEPPPEEAGENRPVDPDSYADG